MRQVTTRHLFDIGEVTPKELEIIKRVNNPNIIKTFKMPMLESVNRMTIRNYVEDIIDFYVTTQYIDNFQQVKRNLDKYVRTLDKKYRNRDSNFLNALSI